MKKRYLIRLDDACPTMNHEKWNRMEELLDKYGVKPMVGIIPKNENPCQIIDFEDIFFWERVKQWEQKGWSLALHGYDHCYISENGMKGLNPMWSRSEFAGLPLEIQKDKIRRGVAIFRENGIEPIYFFAPSHTFDENTIMALKEESHIRIISDTIATRPYRCGEFLYVPQFSGRCREIIFPGFFTFCFHPNTMNDDAFDNLTLFLKANKAKFISFDALDLKSVKNKSLFDKFFSWLYFLQRRVRNNEDSTYH